MMNHQSRRRLIPVFEAVAEEWSVPIRRRAASPQPGPSLVAGPARNRRRRRLADFRNLSSRISL